MSFSVTYRYETWQTSIYDYEGWAHGGETECVEKFDDLTEAVERAVEIDGRKGSGFAYSNVRVVDESGRDLDFRISTSKTSSRSD